MKVRKAKRLPLTETAAARFRREAEKSGMGVADAVKLCAENGWAGLSSSWEGVSNVTPIASQPGGGRVRL